MAIDDGNDNDLGISPTTGTAQKVAKGVTEDSQVDDTTAGQAEEWKPPTREQYEKLQRDLATANRESKDRREKLVELQRSTEDADGKAARERAEAAEARYKPVAVKAAAKAAFLEAGLASVTPEKLGKLTRLLDLDGITISDDGDVVGLTAQVDALKSEFPEMFGAGQQRPRAPRLDTADRKATGGAPKTSAERIAAQVLGGAA